MIIGTHQLQLNSTPTMASVVQCFNDSVETFYLTGSHLTGTTGPKSDIDFFVCQSNKVISDLQAWGFMPMSLSEMMKYDYAGYQKDKSIMTLYRYVTSDGHVDVQIIHPDFIKRKIDVNTALELMASSPTFRTFWGQLTKGKRRDMWMSWMGVKLS